MMRMIISMRCAWFWRSRWVIVAALGVVTVGCADDEYPALTGVVEVAIGGGPFGCAITAEGEGYCFGSAHQVSVSRPPRADLAVRVTLDEPILSTASGRHLTCVVVESGSVYCWGLGAHGELGQGDRQRRDEPTRVPGITTATQVAIGMGRAYGGDHVCVVHDGGRVSCWGNNFKGQIGSMPPGPDLCKGEYSDELNTPCVLSPTEVPGVDSVIQLALGQDHACALREDGEVWCWGDDENWELGSYPMGAPLASSPYQYGRVAPPTRVDGIVAVRIAAGANTTCAIVNEVGRLVCWGGSVQAHEDSMIVDPRSAARAGDILDVGVPLIDVAIGERFACATWGEVEPTIKCWGDYDPGAEGVSHHIVAREMRLCAIVRGQVSCWTRGYPDGPTVIRLPPK